MNVPEVTVMLEIALPPLTSKLTIYTSALELDAELLELVDDSLLEDTDEELVTSELDAELLELVDDSLLEKTEEELVTSGLELVVLIEGSSIVDVDILEDCEVLLEISSEIDGSLIELPLFEQLDKTVRNRIKLRKGFDFMI
jgi:hypothetical protein